MAADQIGMLAFNAAMPVVKNYDRLYDKGKDKVKRIPHPHIPGHRRRHRDDSPDQYDPAMDNQQNGQPPRGYYGDDQYRNRQDSVEEVPRNFPPPGTELSRARSAGRDSQARRPRGRGKYDSTSESESSMSPPPRRRRGKSISDKELAAIGAGAYVAARERALERERQRDGRTDGGFSGSSRDSERNGQSTAVAKTNQSNKGGDDSNSHSDSDSSSVLSSSEDERRHKKLRGKELLTAGLAAVATVHAAGGVYATFQGRDKRREMVKNGEMTPEEARKQSNKAKLQDVAAFGVAALAIKGAYAKWQGAKSTHNMHKQHKKDRSERHEKRLRKGLARENRDNPPARNARPVYARGKESYYNSEPDLRRAYQEDGRTKYQDGNPYGNRR